MNSSFTWAFTLYLLWIGVPALGEALHSTPPPLLADSIPSLPSQSNQPSVSHTTNAALSAATKSGRRLASLDSSVTAEHPAMENKGSLPSDVSDHRFQWLVSFVAGSSSISSPSIDSRVQSGFAAVTGATTLGLNSEIVAWKYLGFGFDGFYELPVNANSNGENLTQKELGVMADMAFRYPLQILGLKIVPKAGLGFGIVSSTSTDSVPSLKISSNGGPQVDGAYSILGVEIDPFRKARAIFDVSRSIAADGAAYGNSLSGAGLARTRVELTYQLWSDFSIGGEFISRWLSGTSSSGQNFSNSEKQFLGVLVYQIK